MKKKKRNKKIVIQLMKTVVKAKYLGTIDQLQIERQTHLE